MKILITLLLLSLIACTQNNNSYQIAGNGPHEVIDLINSYEDCVAAGNKILRSLPPKCVTKDGKVFVKKQEQRNCVDKCGDGTCQELVCMALGCPCSESRSSCPKDCHK